jgi:hypothetical protein
VGACGRGKEREGVEREVHICPCSECRRNPDSRAALLHAALNRTLSRADEKQQRWTAALEAMRLGWGGIRRAAKITGLAPKTISRGIQELRSEKKIEDRVRSEGGGRKPVEKKKRR